jgi:hypothetical protein
MPTTGAGLGSTAVTARQARLSPAGTALNRRRVAPLTVSGCLARDLAAAELRNPGHAGAVGTTRLDQPPLRPGSVTDGGHDDVP